MSERPDTAAPEAESTTDDGPAPRPRKAPPFWVGLTFVLLLGGGYVVTQLITYSGPPITWRNDYAAALAEAKSQKKRVFLLLYEAGCPVTAANDRELFSTRFARERLEKMIPCRVVLAPSDPLRQEFSLTDLPVMLCIEPSGIPIGRIEGRASETQFRTNIHPQ